MKDLIEQIEYKGYKINIYPDQDGESSREWDNLAKLICFHRRYNLGDYQEAKKWDAEEFQEFIEKENGKSIVALPLYLYDHSGITMNTGGFSCRWDSGCVGYAYIDKKEMLKEWGRKRWSEKLQQKAIDIINAEVEIYDQYLTGEVYGYMIETEPDEDGDTDEEGGCWNYYGCDHEKSGLLASAREEIDYMIKYENEKQAKEVNSLQPEEVY